MKRIAVAFITFQDKLLLMLRDNIPTITSPNKWGLIGGHIEEGETADMAMVREAKEEANLTVSNYSLLDKGVLVRENSERVEYHFYHIPLDDNQISEIMLQDEGQAIEFKTLEEMLELDLAFSLKKFLEVDKNMNLVKKILEVNTT